MRMVKWYTNMLAKYSYPRDKKNYVCKYLFEKYALNNIQHFTVILIHKSEWSIVLGKFFAILQFNMIPTCQKPVLYKIWKQLLDKFYRNNNVFHWVLTDSILRSFTLSAFAYNSREVQFCSKSRFFNIQIYQFTVLL